jgi:hypothetical protein
VASRVAKGLYYHVTGHALPRDHIATGIVDEVAADVTNPEARLSMASTIDDVRAALFKKPLTVLGNGVLSYASLFAAEDLRLSLWLLRFYDAATFLAMTEPRARVDPKCYQYDFPQLE